MYASHGLMTSVKGAVLKLAWFICALIGATAAHAVEVSGIRFDDKASVANAELQLNGAGLRTKYFLKVYAIGLYLPQKATTADGALVIKGARRIQLVTLRDLTSDQFSALLEAMAANHSEQEMTRLASRIERFRGTMQSIGKVPEKTIIQLDYLPATGTRLLVGGEQRGADIPGEDFYQALLRIWLGDSPAQADVKEKLLGKP